MRLDDTRTSRIVSHPGTTGRTNFTTQRAVAWHLASQRMTVCRCWDPYRYLGVFCALDLVGTTTLCGPLTVEHVESTSVCITMHCTVTVSHR